MISSSSNDLPISSNESSDLPKRAMNGEIGRNRTIYNSLSLCRSPQGVRNSSRWFQTAYCSPILDVMIVFGSLSCHCSPGRGVRNRTFLQVRPSWAVMMPAFTLMVLCMHFESRKPIQSKYFSETYMVDQENALSLSKFQGPKQVGQPVLGEVPEYVGFHHSTVASANLHAEQNNYFLSKSSLRIHSHPFCEGVRR